MTEAEWLACKDPMRMLHWLLLEKPSVRKIRLAAVACCRRVWPLLPSDRGRRWVEMAERLADGLPVEEDLESERDNNWEAFQHIDGFRRERENNIRWHALLAAQAAIQHEDQLLTGSNFHEHAAWAVAHWHRTSDAVNHDERHFFDELARQAPVILDIFGNPFRPVAVDPTWRTENVTSVAEAIYADRAFDRLPILADALEDAGCDNRDILDHCRQPAEHARGCWVVDLVLGKE